MSKLIVINGTMGIGKSTVAKLVFARLTNAALLDGDDVWRINPFEVNDRTRAVVHNNIRFVLRSYVEAGYEYVILAWVMHRQEIIDTIVQPLGDLGLEVRVFTLFAEEGAAVQRALLRDGAARNPEGVISRLRQSRELRTTQVDTTHRQPAEVADQILAAIGRDGA